MAVGRWDTGSIGVRTAHLYSLQCSNKTTPPRHNRRRRRRCCRNNNNNNDFRSSSSSRVLCHSPSNPTQHSNKTTSSPAYGLRHLQESAT